VGAVLLYVFLWIGASWLEWEAEMTKPSLDPDLRRTMEIIEALGFGVIEHLLIAKGCLVMNQNRVSFRQLSWIRSPRGSPIPVALTSR
jgi:hypothetical protein